MREVEFRAWDKRRNWMLYDGDSCGYVEVEKHEVDVINLILSKGYHEDLTFLQFTGLLDKDDCGIYEGDIISGISNQNLEVVFHQGSFGVFVKMRVSFHTEELKPLFTALHCYDSEDLEVIGNVFENPGLLNY